MTHSGIARHTLAMSLLTFALAAQPLHAQADGAAHHYSVQAASLAQALTGFSAQANITVQFAPALTQGLNSSGLDGDYSVEQGLAVLLAGSGLEAIQLGERIYGLVKISPASGDTLTLQNVDINASRTSAEGSEAAGYVSENISNVGALGGMKLQDTPFSMSVTSQALLKNIQATSTDDVFKRNPFAQLYSPKSAGYASAVTIRGFGSSASLNIANDGLRFSTQADAGNFIEDTEQLEVITGLTGFLYGPASPGGLANYVLKRPTYQRYNSVTLGNAGGQNYYLHGDFGGPIDSEGRFAYRLNVLTQDGETAIDLQKRRRQMVSLALDWNVSDDLLVQFEASHKESQTRGLTSYWFFANQAYRPSASSLDTDKLYSQKWAFADNETDKAGVRAKWRLNDTFSLRAAFAAQQFTQEYTYTGPQLDAPGRYTQPLYAFAPLETQEYSGYLFLDSQFETGPLDHKMTLGFQGNSARSLMYEDHIPSQQYTSVTGSAVSLDERPQVSKPGYSVGHGAQHISSTTDTRNLLIGDIITFNEQWSTILGATHTNISAYNNDFVYAATPLKTRYDKSKTSPSLSLIYKPVPWLTTYATYIEGLQSGGVAPSRATNAGTALAPQISEQYEIGAKATLGETLVTLALFNIDKPNAYTNSARLYVQDGRQENNGLEFSITGKVTPQLTLVSGFTLLDPEVKKGATAANNGNTPINVAKQIAKVYAEYDMTSVPGFALTGGAFYTGEQYADEANNYKLPSFTTFDAGARYRLPMGDNKLTLRMNVSNLTDKKYWLNSSYLGDPRTVAFSAQLEF
ncbi:TonB-dependent siderophore receptor [Pseudomonas cichorii]|uniref:TonB-dependent siderophore receptor n=1 Tax=Pseudomonas cichorii TaxID=36746 RepID=A0A3M4M116_PSECI|nr:TonB-dependent receptor [Pseudomonas cichorii]RMQ47417.1 TonB-dependent siderophore receptor [Pseudomonas cichorii]